MIVVLSETRTNVYPRFSEVSRVNLSIILPYYFDMFFLCLLYQVTCIYRKETEGGEQLVAVQHSGSFLHSNYVY